MFSIRPSVFPGQFSIGENRFPDSCMAVIQIADADTFAL